MTFVKQHILVVDSDRNNYHFIKQALEGLGYGVDSATNEAEARQLLSRKKYHLVLLELYLRGRNGIDLLRYMVTDHPEVRVIVASAHGTIEDAVQVMKLGAIDFLQKPFTANQLCDLVTDSLDPNRVMAQQLSNYRSLLEVARHFIDIRDLDAALVEAHRAIGLDPERPEAFNLLGVLSELSGDHHEAMKHYRVALDLDPTYEPARQNMNQNSARRQMLYQPHLG